MLSVVLAVVNRCYEKVEVHLVGVAVDLVGVGVEVET